MPSHEPENPETSLPLSAVPSHGEYPDEISRSELDEVSMSFDANTGQRAKRAVVIAVGILLACFLLVVVLRFFHAHGVAKAGEVAFSTAPPVDIVIARAATAGQDLVLPGETAAWYETTIYARVNGYVARWLVDIGDHVKKGQSLAVIETPELDAELQAAKAQLSASLAQVSARKAEAEFSKTTNERWRDSPKGVVSDQEREAKKADYETAEARLYAAESQVNLDKSKVEQYGALAEFKLVKAPFDGTITERKIDIGNLVAAGSGSTTTPLYRMAQTDPLRIFVDVPQSAAGELMNAGAPAEIRATGAVGGVFAGKIARSAESINPQARTMRVEVDMPNTNHALVPGMYVNIAFRLPPRGLVEVPAAALIFRAGTTQVAKVDSAGKITFENVAIARDDGSMVELASGVLPGERLVLNISSQIAAGQTVAVNDPEAANKQLEAKR
ncbi:MAG TPA: efflux RND transporter periplasmic adaptor subunit [Steroidobacteraceae bacterium]|jgi:RND family efflux transporter MFP subunit|nr:efflux RND transporter periplasmic adaptor subunit [Steroidobacteraceae bacterium]